MVSHPTLLNHNNKHMIVSVLFFLMPYRLLEGVVANQRNAKSPQGETLRLGGKQMCCSRFKHVGR